MKTTERETVTFTREQFYETVWSAPATKIAKELGCSDVLIGKICKACKIPKPYLGYWAKLQHGKKPKKTPLQRCDDPEIQSLTFYKHPKQETTIDKPESDPDFDPDIQQMLDKAKSLQPVEVPPSLSRPHPLVRATRERLQARFRPTRDWSSRDSKGHG